MITLPIENTDKVLYCDSSWDSGTHTGFHINLQRVGGYGNTTTLDELLSREQIKGLEAILISATNSYLKENKQ